MHPRKEKQQTNSRLRAPRVPSIPSVNNLFSKALTKEIFLFDQSFFIAQAIKKRVFLFDQSFFIAQAIKKRVFLFDQSFFIAQAFKKRVFLFDHGFSVSYLILRFQTKLISLWKLIFQPKFIFQFYISYLTPAS